EHWQWSRYPGHVTPGRLWPWVGHEALLAAWRGEHGGRDTASAYGRFVEEGLVTPPAHHSGRSSAAGRWGRTASSNGWGAGRPRPAPIRPRRRRVTWRGSTGGRSAPRWRPTTGWRRGRCRAVATRTSRERRPPGCAAAIPKRPRVNWS